MNERVAVVIPAYNAERTIAETLKALRAQAGIRDFEVIVADNGSTDRTPEIARELGAKVVFESKRGPSAARNRGVAATDAPIIAHLDSDTVPSRRWLASLVRPFEDRNTVIVAGNTQCYPPQTPAERYVAQSGLYFTPRALSREQFPFAPSLNMAVRRDAVLAAGGWAEDMMTGEDVDFSHRVTRAFGTGIAYAEDALLYHRTRADRQALIEQARSYGRGAAHLFRRYPSELQWDVLKTLALIRQTIQRLFARIVARIGRALGKVDDLAVEFADYHWTWTSNYWAGFINEKRSCE
jgi:glycosyltransferase involved in cell wall biosynthesis